MSAQISLLPLTSSAADSPVRTSAAQAKELASLVLKAAYGVKWPEWSRIALRDGLLWKTSQVARSSGSTTYASTWASSDMHAYRSRLRQAIVGHGIGADECSWNEERNSSTSRRLRDEPGRTPPHPHKGTRAAVRPADHADV